MLSTEILAQELEKIKFLKPIVKELLPFAIKSTDTVSSIDDIGLNAYVNSFALKNHTLAQIYVAGNILSEDDDYQWTKLQCEMANLFTLSELEYLQNTLKEQEKGLLLSLNLGSNHLNNLVSRKENSQDKDKEFIIGFVKEMREEYKKIEQGLLKKLVTSEMESKASENTILISTAKEEKPAKKSVLSYLFKKQNPIIKQIENEKAARIEMQNINNNNNTNTSSFSNK